MRSQAMVLSLAMIVGVVSACSSGGSGSTPLGPSSSNPTPTAGANPTIVASSTTTGGSYGSGGNYYFSPTPLTVAAGTTVTYQFGTVTHNVHFTAAANAPDSIASTANASVPRTFTTAGTFNYHCTIHNIDGVVVVQ